MRSAQSRLGLVSSLGAARRDVMHCAELLPRSARALRLGAGIAGGLAGVVLLRALLPSRRRPAAPAAVPVRAPRKNGMGRYLLTQSVALLFIPLCRHYLLGENTPVSTRLVPLIEHLFRKAR